MSTRTQLVKGSHRPQAGAAGCWVSARLQAFLVDEVQVYPQPGCLSIHDKHIEVIVARCCGASRSSMRPGVSTVSWSIAGIFEAENRRVVGEGRTARLGAELMRYHQLAGHRVVAVRGVLQNRPALPVLTIRRARDHLMGLKEQ